MSLIKPVAGNNPAFFQYMGTFAPSYEKAQGVLRGLCGDFGARYGEGMGFGAKLYKSGSDCGVRV